MLRMLVSLPCLSGIGGSALLSGRKQPDGPDGHTREALTQGWPWHCNSVTSLVSTCGHRHPKVNRAGALYKDHLWNSYILFPWSIQIFNPIKLFRKQIIFRDPFGGESNASIVVSIGILCKRIMGRWSSSLDTAWLSTGTWEKSCFPSKRPCVHQSTRHQWVQPIMRKCLFGFMVSKAQVHSFWGRE